MISRFTTSSTDKSKHAAGNFIEPNIESAKSTLQAVELPENLRAFISDPEGENSYPIVTYTWLLTYKEYPDSNTSQALEKMIEDALNEGQAISPELGYIALPDNVRQKVAEAADVINPDYKITIK